MEMLPLERRIWRGGARSATAPAHREGRLGLHRLLAAGTAAAVAATTMAAVRIATAGLEAAAGLSPVLAPLALALARLDPDFAARVALGLGALVAARGLSPARRAARPAYRLGVLGDDRRFLAQAFGQRDLVERDLGQPLDVAQIIAL